VNEQLELIFNLLGTPTVEEIYKISKSDSRDIVLKFGNVEKKNLSDLFPGIPLEGK
jgi:hypothetical protein